MRKHILPLFVLLSGCMGTADSAANDPQVYAAYTMLAPTQKGGVQVYARAIVDGAHISDQQCPQLLPSSGEVIKTQARRLNPDPDNFPVTVCEAVINPDTRYRLSYGGIELAPVTLAPEHIQVFGDSGCKSSVCEGASAAQPFAQLADLGAKQTKQLILHMGDFNYRGTSGSISKDIYAYDAGDGGYGGPSCGLTETYYSQNASGSPKPDTWQSWQADLFAPAKSLLASAPWVFARGNHELCSRAGPGWFYFLGPGSDLPGGIAQQSCPYQGEFSQPPSEASGHIVMIDPYLLELDSLALWVMDSANACDSRAPQTLTRHYRDQYSRLQQVASQVKTPLWMMTHRPLWGQSGPVGTPSITDMLQTALKTTQSQQLPPEVSLSLSGHMHIYQSLAFGKDSGRPPQLVVGNSGVSLRSTGANSGFSAQIDGKRAQGNTQGEFGYISIKLEKDQQWQGQFYNTQGKVFLECGSKQAEQGKALCQIAR
ncbi:metallophosphoesterase [Pseudoalteromonas sp. DL2-H2.2]|uniref:metallophosphoesterase n=1 Tax=Pseudoalteromonas sp. DL2-H2.2 TaxID=2908889 RepID=UPI001F23EA99|nr:metallophosphoesterase [Pseudoalteromonas sp. DL2-H2.2]MCF2906967.1 metallophosphoesterase [Pseudoalteromonas sp. DL2-H2.2]